MLRALRSEPGVEEVLELRPHAVGFLALHGGNQDRRTELIAGLAAEGAGASMYALVQPPTLRWHLPSHRYDPAKSHALRAFLDHVEVVVSVHGYGRDAWWLDWIPPRENWPPDRQNLWERYWYPRAFLVGGMNRDLARSVGRALRRAVPDYPTVDELDDIPRGARGLHPRNPVNLSRGGGAQIEIPPGPRGLDGDVPRFEEVAAALTTVAGSLR